MEEGRMNTALCAASSHWFPLLEPFAYPGRFFCEISFTVLLRWGPPLR
jgi:hypothetical protein